MEGCHKVCVRAQTFSVNVCVCPSWTVYDDTFPLCLLETSKRHLRHSLTLNSIYSFLWEFTASALNSQSNYPHAHALQQTPLKCGIQSSTYCTHVFQVNMTHSAAPLI